MFFFWMIRKIYQLVALVLQQRGILQNHPHARCQIRESFFCVMDYGRKLYRPHKNKNRRIKRISRKITCVSTNLHLQVLKDDHLSKILCKDHLWKKSVHLAPPAFFTPLFPNEKFKHERSNQGTKVPRLSTLDIQKRSLHLKVSVGLAHFVRTFPHWGPERSRRRRCRWYWDSRQVGYQRMLVFLGVFLGELTGVHSRLKIDRVHLSHHFRNEDVSFFAFLQVTCTKRIQKGQKLEKHINVNH